MADESAPGATRSDSPLPGTGKTERREDGVDEIGVRTGGGREDYSVWIGSGLLERLPELVSRHAPAHEYAVISDGTVAGLYGGGVAERLEDAGIRARLFSFPPGEEHKSRESWIRLTDALLDAGFGRDSAVVAVGGGVTGDLSGFVAATFMRGVPVIQVPTSLVAMIDASVGGKTGVDVPGGKNLVGAFHPPRAVVADPRVIRTLPRPERSEGCAEALKHGAIRDEAHFEELEESSSAILDGAPEAVKEAVSRSVRIKAEVVSRDEREGGLRKILNFGHTLGHALEAASRYELSHGSAVGVGMILEAQLGEGLGVTESGTGERIRKAVAGLGLPVEAPPGLEVSRVIAYTRSDKKGREGRPRYVLLSRLGEVAGGDGEWTHEVPDGAVAELLHDEGLS